VYASPIASLVSYPKALSLRGPRRFGIVRSRADWGPLLNI
jgi:hypothetical protein